MKNLDELCDFINGGAWSDKEYSEVGIPVLKVSNIKGQGIDSQNISFIPFESKEKYSKHILHKNDLVIATVGSHPNLVNSAAGRSIRINNSGLGYLLNQNAVCLRTRDQQVLDQIYLAYLGQTEDFKIFIQQRGRGAANQMRIAIGSVKEFEPYLPPLPIQKRIATILSAYDDLIENNLKRIKLLEEIAQRTYEEWFVKFRVNGEQLPIDEITGLPLGWERKKITECLSFSQYKQKIKPFKGELKYLATADVDGTLITGEGELITWENKPSRAQIKLIRESVWFARMSKTYKVILTTSNFNHEFVISSGFAGFSPKNSHCLPFLFCLINSNDFDEKKNLFATGSTQVSLNDISLSSILVIEPEIGLIESFGKLFLRQLELRQNLIDQNQKLKQSRDILLPRLMSGTINVES